MVTYTHVTCILAKQFHHNLIVSNYYCYFFLYSLEVILRAEAVEMTQAGDKCDFIGTLIVVPDVSQIQTMGATAETSTRVKGGEAGDSEGVR